MSKIPLSAVKHPVLPLWATPDGAIYGPRGKRAIHKDRYGYWRLSYVHEGKHRKITVHRVVAEVFFGTSRLTVNHKNGNKDDNSVGNLEFISAAANTTHSFRSGSRSKICHVVHLHGETYYSKRECERVTGVSRRLI